MKKGIMRMSSRLKGRLPKRKKVEATENEAPGSNRDNISVEHDSDKSRGRGITGMLLGMIVWPIKLCGRIAMLPLVLARKVTVGIFSKKAKKLASRVAETGESSVATDKNEQIKTQQSNAENKSIIQKLIEEIIEIIRNSIIGKLYFWDPVEWPRRLGRRIVISILGIGPSALVLYFLVRAIVWICGFVILQDTTFCMIVCDKIHVGIKCK